MKCQEGRVMDWIINMAAIAGISADLFASMECQGALVADVDKKHLYQVGVFMALWQTAALFLGIFVSGLLSHSRMTVEERAAGAAVSALIFFGLGISMVRKAIKKEQIQEHLEENLGFRRFVSMEAAESLLAIFAGIAVGFLRTGERELLMMAPAVTFVVIIGGMYTGYHLGFANKTKVYVCGALFFWLAAATTTIGLLGE